MVLPSRQEVEELDICPALGTHPPLASFAEGLLPQEVVAQAFLDPMNAMAGFPPPRPEPFPLSLSALLI